MTLNIPIKCKPHCYHGIKSSLIPIRFDFTLHDVVPRNVWVIEQLGSGNKFTMLRAFNANITE